MKYESFLRAQKHKLLKAIHHLEYSYQKILSLPSDLKQLDEETLETWESFAARFCRVADLFLTRFIRSYVLIQDPGFIGTLRDYVNQAEKMGLIENAETWMSIRELRNITAHDYTEKDLSEFFDTLREEAPRLISLKEKL